MSAELPPLPDWKQLVSLARAQVKAVLRSLPPPLRARAQQVPVTYEHVPGDDLLQDGIEPDTLGLFVGPDFAEAETTPSPIPPQIILFLDNLWDISEEDVELFQEEIRVTLLHELGHYLGLDEEELFDRGLE
jgi:predicted Zn-dependent protease with MMP-like domain